MANPATTTAEVKEMIRTIPNLTTQQVLFRFLDLLEAGATGSVTAGASSEALTVKNGVITAIGS